MSIEIVKFINEKYGIRKRNLFHKILGLEGVFRDFNPQFYLWKKTTDQYFPDCQVDDLSVAINELAKIKGTYVKEVIKHPNG